MDKLKCLGFAEPEHSSGASGADSLGFESRHGFGSREGSPSCRPRLRRPAAFILRCRNGVTTSGGVFRLDRRARLASAGGSKTPPLSEGARRRKCPAATTDYRIVHE